MVCTFPFLWYSFFLSTEDGYVGITWVVQVCRWLPVQVIIGSDIKQLCCENCSVLYCVTLISAYIWAVAFMHRFKLSTGFTRMFFYDGEFVCYFLGVEGWLVVVQFQYQYSWLPWKTGLQVSLYSVKLDVKLVWYLLLFWLNDCSYSYDVCLLWWFRPHWSGHWHSWTLILTKTLHWGPSRMRL